MSPALDTSTHPRFTTLRLPRQGALCVRGFQFTTAPPDTQREHRDRERDVVPTLQSACPALAVPFGVSGRREAEEAKKSLDASKSKNDCNAEERSSGAVSYAGGDCGVSALAEERERINRTIWDPKKPNQNVVADRPRSRRRRDRVSTRAHRSRSHAAARQSKFRRRCIWRT